MIQRFQVKSSSRTDFIDITSAVQGAVSQAGVQNGVCFVYIPHTTAAVTINENADLSVAQDLKDMLNKMVPFENRYLHLEGNSAAHIKSSLLGCSQTVLVESGQLALGTWQGIFLCEFDGPRLRQVCVKTIQDKG